MIEPGPPPATPHDGPPAAARPAWRGAAVAAAIVLAMFCAFSAVRSPVPGVNEPHFLAKAKRYWDPAWCPGDFYLDSANAHQVFFQAMGLVAQVLPLDATAWVGRVAALALLAGGWTALVRRLLQGAWAAVWTGAVFLFFAALGNLSGEWLVGGVEAKVFSYAFVFFALAMLIGRRWIAAGASGGLAIALHPVVGMWSALAAFFALAVELGVGRIANPSAAVGQAFQPAREPSCADTGRADKDVCPTNIGRIGDPSYGRSIRVALGVALLVLFSLPGLWPALAMLGEDDEPLRRAAGYIQVGHRLAHHLDPLTFPPWSWLGYAALTAVWIAGWWWGVFRSEKRVFAWFVLAALVFALGGLAIGLRAEPLGQTPFAELSPLDFLRIRLLRFYPFRLYDALAPLAAAVAVVGLTEWTLSRIRGAQGPPRRVWPVAKGVAIGAIFLTALALPAADRNPSRYSERRMADWREMCRWIDAETPADAEFVTPDESWAFHWYAERAEYVSYKNCPQDAPGIVEWNRRIQAIHDWATRRYDDRRYDLEDLRALRAATGAAYLLADRLGPMTVAPVHANGSYRLYRLDGLLADKTPQ